MKSRYEIIKVLKRNSSSMGHKDIRTLCLKSYNYENVAGQILEAMQSNEDCLPQLDKPNVSGSCEYTEADMCNFADWYRNGLSNLEYASTTVQEQLNVWRNLR